MHLPPVSHSPQVGEKTVPHSDSVYRLREAMLAATEGENSPALEEVRVAGGWRLALKLSLKIPID